MTDGSCSLSAARTKEEIKIIDATVPHSYSKVYSCGLSGINAYAVEIEVDISGGLPNFILVGLPDTAVNESRERVRAAIKSSGMEFPRRKIIVNLAPCDTKKAGPTYDLGIAIGILANCELINKDNLDNLWVVGELGLSGNIRHINGVLSYVILAKNKNAKGIIIPKENEEEASLIPEIKIYGVSNLNEAIYIINNLNTVEPIRKIKKINKQSDNLNLDFSEVKGQYISKRALEIAACGGHHVLMIGPPGCGKSMLAQRQITILPELSHEEKIEVTQIYSAAGKLGRETKLLLNRPFRSPHHSTSIPGLIGGGPIPQPGEISLAHKGILFLDEFTEFQKQVLDSLRQALEIKEITISRSRRSCTFPCDFTLVAACNPCPCGYFGDSIKKCICNLNHIKKYQSKISGPIIDRIDLQTEVKRLTENEIMSNDESESSKIIRERILKARDIQKWRYKDKSLKTNSHLTNKEIKTFCKTNDSGMSVLKEAIKNLGLSARSYDRVLKVSRTIADLNGSSDIIKDEHILEALQFRLNTLNKQ